MLNSICSSVAAWECHIYILPHAVREFGDFLLCVGEEDHYPS